MTRAIARCATFLTIILGVGALGPDRVDADQEQRVQAQPLQAQPGPVGALADGCLTAPANATVALAPNTTSASNTSPNAQYGTASCDRYVVDFTVGSNASQVPNQWDPGFTITASDSQISAPFIDAYTNHLTTAGQCANWGDTVTSYKKANGAAAFTRLGTVTRHGEWLTSGPYANHCIIRTTQTGTSTWSAMNPPANGTDVYRVAVKSTAGRGLRPVQARITHTNHIPPS